MKIKTTQTFNATINALTLALPLVPLIKSKLIRTTMNTAGMLTIPPSHGPPITPAGM